MVLYPDKTNYILFSRSTTRHDIELFCNNNNENQNIADNVSVIRRVTNNDTVPAVKFLGVFFIPPFHLNFTSLKLKISSLRHFMPSGQLKKHLTKTALNYYTFPFFTAILFMPFKFGRVRVLVPSMTCSKFKNPLFVLSLALHTILTRNHFLKSCKFHPSPTLFL